jgi:hypothetical protein
MSAIENIKDIADIIKKIGDIDLYRKIVELEQEVFELSRSNIKLQSEIEALKSALTLKLNIKYKKPFYYINEDPSPYCPNCYDVGNILVHLLDGSDPNYFICPNCNKAIKAN